MDIIIASMSDINTIIQARFDFLTQESCELLSMQYEQIQTNLYQYSSHNIGKTFFVAMIKGKQNELKSIAFLTITEKPACCSFPTGKIAGIYNVLTYSQYRNQG